MQQRPKPPPSYYKILIPPQETHHPLQDCPYCKNNAPFVFGDGSLGFQDKRAQTAYERFLRDDLGWYNLSLIGLSCGLTPVEFEKIHGPRPQCNNYAYMLDGVLLTQHWSRYLEGQCNHCGTKIWRDFGVPPHYYYHPPQPFQLPLPLSSAGDTKSPPIPPINRRGNDWTSFQDIFRCQVAKLNGSSHKRKYRKEYL